MIYDLNSNASLISAIGYAILSSNVGPIEGSIIDTLGFEGITAFVRATTPTTGEASFTIQEGDLSNGSDMVDIPQERITNIGNLTVAISIVKLGFIPNKRYVRIVANPVGVTDLGISGAIALVAPNQGPV